MRRKKKKRKKKKEMNKKRRRRKVTLETHRAAFNSWITLHGTPPHDSTTGCFCVFMNNAVRWANAFPHLETGS